MSTEKLDVLIVGAGLSGLTAAYELHKRAPDLKCLVLEASNRIGGRTWSVPLKCATGTDRFDFGGQWVGKSQPHIMNMVNELGLQLYPQYTKGKNRAFLATDKTVEDYDGDDIPGSLFSGMDVWNLFRKLQKRSEKVSPMEPFKDRKANDWNSMTLKQFLDREGYTSEGRSFVELVCESMFDCKADHLSLLFFFMYMNSAGTDVDIMTGDTGDAAQAFKVANGAQTISETFLGIIGKDRLVMEEPVVKLVQETSSVVVYTLKGKTYNAKRTIMAIPPNQVGKVEFSPILPAGKMILMRNLAPKSESCKFVITYSEAFWRNQGYSGEIMSIPAHETKTYELLPGILTVDAVSNAGSAALVGFMDLPSHLTTEKRKSLVIKQISRCLGSKAESPLDYKDQFWCNEPYIKGCIGTLGPAAMSPHYPSYVRKPHGGIHWAGTETATVWMGYMSGAIQAGQRVAHEVLGHLKPEAADKRFMADSIK